MTKNTVEVYIPGPKGNVGPIGPLGPVGPVGPIGPIGATGLIGPTGLTGPQGLTGPLGPIGPIGPRGPIGPTGLTGSIGPVGPIGQTGPTGPIGPLGPIGPQGLTGDINYEVASSNRNVFAGDLIAADTSSGSFTLTLPSSPNNGDAIDIVDYSGTFPVNPLTVSRNGNKIEGLEEDLVCNVPEAYFTLVYAGLARGWQVLPRYGSSADIGATFNNAVDPVRCDSQVYFGNGTAYGSNITVADRICILSPVLVTRNCSYKHMAFRLGTAGTTVGGSVKVGLYNTGVQGLPDTLIIEQEVPITFPNTGSTLLTSTNIAQNNIILKSGIYWMAFFNYMGSTQNFASASPSSAWLINATLGSNGVLASSSTPEAINTFITVASGNSLPATLSSRTFQHSINTPGSTTMRFRVNTPILHLAYYL